MTGHRDQLTDAFPASIRDDVLAALTWMPLDAHRPVPDHPVSTRGSIRRR